MFIKILSLIFLLILPSCKSNKENVLAITDSDKIDKRSALSYEKISKTALFDLLFNPLLYTGSDKPHYVLADDVKVFPGNRVVEVRLREGVRFHNGRELTADDLAFAVDILKREEALKNLKMEVLDRIRFRLTNDQTISDVNSLLSNIYAYSGGLNGTGPFRFKKWFGNGVELAANEDYFEGRPKIDKIIYLFEEDEKKRISRFLRGEADLLLFVSPEAAHFLEKDGRFYVNAYTSGFYTALFFNNESPIFRDKPVRTAVSTAIDRDYLVEKGLEGAGVQASGPFLPETLPSGPGTWSLSGFAPKKAAALLKDAGWGDADGDGILEKGGKKLIFRLYYLKEIEEMKKLVDLISKNLFEIGIGVEGIAVTFDDIKNNYIRAGDYDALMSLTSSDDETLFRLWHSSSQNRPDGINFSRFRNEDMDSLLEGLRVASNIEDKKVIYGKQQQIFEEYVPAAFLYHSVTYTAASRKFKGAEGFVGNVESIYRIKDWSTEGR